MTRKKTGWAGPPVVAIIAIAFQQFLLSVIGVAWPLGYLGLLVGFFASVPVVTRVIGWPDRRQTTRRPSSQD